MQSVCVIVAHPDDEVLWAGGLLLMQTEWQRRIVSVCRGNDADRAPRFRRALTALRASGDMADLDDGLEQSPLDEGELRDTIIRLTEGNRYDHILTHGPRGEYTRHRRHEEVSICVQSLWLEEKLAAGKLWLFAYEDGGRAYPPRSLEDADCVLMLPEEIWAEKIRILRDVYGFSDNSWEVRSAPRVEAFMRYGGEDLCSLTAVRGDNS